LFLFNFNKYLKLRPSKRRSFYVSLIKNIKLKEKNILLKEKKL